MGTWQLHCHWENGVMITRHLLLWPRMAVLYSFIGVVGYSRNGYTAAFLDI